MLKWSFLCISFCLLPLTSIAWHYWEEPGPILSTPSLQILPDIDEVPSQWCLLKAEQGTAAFFIREMLQSPYPLCHPLLGLLQELHISSGTEEPRSGHSTPDVASQGLGRGAESCPLTCWQCSSQGTPVHQVLWLSSRMLSTAIPWSKTLKQGNEQSCSMFKKKKNALNPSKCVTF